MRFTLKDKPNISKRKVLRFLRDDKEFQNLSLARSLSVNRTLQQTMYSCNL